MTNYTSTAGSPTKNPTWLLLTSPSALKSALERIVRYFARQGFTSLETSGLPWALRDAWSAGPAGLPAQMETFYGVTPGEDMAFSSGWHNC